MKRVLASGFVVIIAAAMLVGAAGAGTRQPPTPETVALAQAAEPSPIDGVPADALPEQGKCKLWYDALPPERQAAQMDCQHARWLAQSWGGRVISSDRELAHYHGRNDFTGVPVSALPQRGFCRAWLNGVAENAQPVESDCRVARQTADRSGGRVIFMPL